MDFPKKLNPLIFLIIVCFVEWSIKSRDIDSIIAVSGWSPIDWVSHLNNPQNYSNDFPSGISLYDKSAFMKIYPFLNNVLGISTETSIYFVLLLEIFFLAFSGFYFFKALIPKSSLIAGCIFSLMVISSSARNMDLSNFGAPIFAGLFYNFADGFRLLAIALFLDRKFLLFGLSQAISIIIHPIMGIMSLVFLFGIFTIKRKVLDLNSLFKSFVPLIIIVFIWIFFTFKDSNIGSGQINPDTWVEMVQLFSVHLFPLTLKPISYVLSFISLLILAFYYLPKIDIVDNDRKGILFALYLMVFIAILGMLITLFLPIPFLVKMQLPRISALVINVSLAIVIVGLIKEVENKNYLCGSLELAILLASFFINPGFRF